MPTCWCRFWRRKECRQSRLPTTSMPSGTEQIAPHAILELNGNRMVGLILVVSASCMGISLPMALRKDCHFLASDFPNRPRRPRTRVCLPEGLSSAYRGRNRRPIIKVAKNLSVSFRNPLRKLDSLHFGDVPYPLVISPAHYFLKYFRSHAFLFARRDFHAAPDTAAPLMVAVGWAWSALFSFTWGWTTSGRRPCSPEIPAAALRRGRSFLSFPVCSVPPPTFAVRVVWCESEEGGSC